MLGKAILNNKIYSSKILDKGIIKEVVMKIAINGAGIAGSTLAWWLKKYGFQPVLFEKAPSLRTGGYLVDFWGPGCEIMKKMGLFTELKNKSYKIKNIHCFNQDGRRSSKIDICNLIKDNYDEFLSIKRGDLAASIYNACEGIDIRSGTTIENIEEKYDSIVATLSDGTKEEFYLVIGADGLHSHTRSLVFDKSQYQEYDLNKYIAVCSFDKYSNLEKFTYAVSVSDQQQVARVSLNKDETLIMFTIDASLVDKFPTTLADKKKIITNAFKDFKWEVPDILTKLNDVKDIYFDKVSQIKMDTWHKGKVALIGDAAACPSFLMGFGSIFATVEAYILAGELYKTKGDYTIAFEQWQNKLKDIIDRKQKLGLTNLSVAANDDITHKYLSTLTVKISSTPIISKFIGAGIFNEPIKLPEY
jgi:2-polyprenyl-6-methoxyphenol hydroxylase-like FAD-dependent oxidoreductase